MNQEDILKLQMFLQQKFGGATFDVRPRPKQEDSCEVYLGEEFLGVVFLDDEDGDRSFMFQMAILDIDLEEF